MRFQPMLTIFIGRQISKRLMWPDHGLAHPLGLGLGPHLAMDVEPCVAPRQNPRRPFRAEEFLADKIPQNLMTPSRN